MPNSSQDHVLGSSSPSKANILIVDDRQENLTALDAILAPLGENVLLARSGEEALRYVLKNDLAVILLDVKMPNLDGIETARLIRQRDRSANIPIIFITALSQTDQAAVEGYAVGAVDYIGKPFNPTILCSKVRVFVDLYRKNAEIQRQAKEIHEAELRAQVRIAKLREQKLEQERLVAHQNELEIKVAERTAQLVAANAEMEAFCYSVSHDLRAPLRAITSTSMIVLNDAEDRLIPDEIEQLRRQAAAAKKLGLLIDDLLLLSRLGRREMEIDEVDLSALAAEVAQDVSARYLDRKIGLHIEPMLKASGDRRLLRLLLSNLIDNAFKYSPEGGSIRVEKAASEKGDAFAVRDTGVGFEMKYSKKLFLPFERLVGDGEFPGTGIGLAIANRIVQRHGGKIWAESEPGKGATFMFTLTGIPSLA